jgi:twitching motility protein PilJ
VQDGQDKIGRQEMAATIDDEQTYQQAYKAYVQRNYEQAATLINQAVVSLPNDPNTHLLRGHIYYVLQQYDIAKEEYQKVLALTDDSEIIDFANNGLENISKYQTQAIEATEVDEHAQLKPSHLTETIGKKNLEKLEDREEVHENLDFKSSIDEVEKVNSISPFEVTIDTVSEAKSKVTGNVVENPFGFHQVGIFEENTNKNNEEHSEFELSAFWQEDLSQLKFEDFEVNSNLLYSQDDSSDSPFLLSKNQATSLKEESLLEQNNDNIPFRSEEETLPTDENSQTTHSSTLENSHLQNVLLPEETSSLQILEATIEIQRATPEAENYKELSSQRISLEVSAEEKPSNLSSRKDQNYFESSESFNLETFESNNNIDFLDDFDEFDDLGNIPKFDITEDSTFGSSQSHSSSKNTTSGQVLKSVGNTATSSAMSSDRDAELFSMTGSQEAIPVFVPTDVAKIEPQVSVEQGFLAPLENASLQRKQWLIAGTVGIVSAIVVATVSFVSANFSPPQQRESVRNTGWAMTLAAGIAGFVTTGLMGNLAFRQIRRTTKDLQSQFEAVRQGNLNVQATVYSEDEFGQLATGFNEMTRVIFATTNEATRKAQEQEEAKENLQRQVIRLLDDVEGAARGDLTVQAEVTADVLGAVADAFNLTIQNLRDIVQQVKVAAREVTKGATNSETFATALSSDALRQAEELAVTLSSVQVMTDSIQRVAEAAREAEAVARDAREIALKGGDAVENTVAGILEIRETVAETTRKVKRLAESSQEISKIVALISQIASRTNLLALNASIEAARAGEAGRGFAIVADEVRQLADKSAKSLKEIEQIVMQIQSETGSVMTAMEEGTQQVIQGTKLAEEAKRSLEDIIQVAKRIDILVRSITSDTVEQTETSRAVAQVMQSVELTAQETSQEAQRVSGALQHLVGVSRDLIASVERFRVETAESR